MFSQFMCSLRISYLNLNEIQNFMKLIHPDWDVLEEKIIRDFTFEDYNSAISFTNL